MTLLQKKSLRKKRTEKFGDSFRFVIMVSKADIWWENNCWLPCQCSHWRRKGSQRKINPFSSFCWLFESLMRSSKLSEIWEQCSFRQVLPTWKRHPSQEEVRLVSLLFTPQRQLTYRSRNSVELNPKDLEWLPKDLCSLDWFNRSGYQATEVKKESGDNNRVSNIRYLLMIQASPTEWPILNTVRLSFLLASGGKPVI